VVLVSDSGQISFRVSRTKKMVIFQRSLSIFAKYSNLGFDNL
jgi:hypothetical protein